MCPCAIWSLKSPYTPDILIVSNGRDMNLRNLENKLILFCKLNFMII